MPLDYKPEDASNCFPVGEYSATLTSVEDTTSQKGHPMQHAVWTVYNGDRKQLVDEYIVNPSTIFRLKQIARAMGKLPEFEKRQFQLDDHIGANIVVKLSIEKSDEFGDRNRIQYYKAKNSGNGLLGHPPSSELAAAAGVGPARPRPPEVRRKWRSAPPECARSDPHRGRPAAKELPRPGLHLR